MEDLVNALRQGRVILFVGAGVSKNLGIPDFAGLIRFMADELGFDPGTFHGFGDYLMLAEYYRIRKGTLEPLMAWLHEKSNPPAVDVGGSRIHELIVRLKCGIIYTTNYDHWLEAAHDHFGASYKRVVRVRDIPEIHGDPVQIVKFHGDFEDADSIVLSESSFLKRLSFESPLDIKLRADAMGRTILFIGYSLSDINIRYLLYKIHVQWEESDWAYLRPKSYVFLAYPNPVQETIMRERGVHAFVSQKEDPGEGLQLFLEELVERAGRSSGA